MCKSADCLPDRSLKFIQTNVLGSGVKGKRPRAKTRLNWSKTSARRLSIYFRVICFSFSRHQPVFPPTSCGFLHLLQASSLPFTGGVKFLKKVPSANNNSASRACCICRLICPSQSLRDKLPGVRSIFLKELINFVLCYF